MTEIPLEHPKDSRRRLLKGSRRRRVKVILLLGFVVLLLAYTGLDLWAGYKAGAEIARLEERYGSLHVDTMLVPPVPADDNRARIVRAAAALTVPESREGGRPANRFVSQRASSPVPADVRAFAEANQSAVRLAEDVRTRRQSNWEVDNRSGYDQPPWEGIRTLSNAIYVTARLELEAGRVDEASQVVVSGLAVTASIRQEPGLLAQLWRIFHARQQLDAVQRLVVESEPSSAALDELARWLVENREPDSTSGVLLGELKHYNAALTRTENGFVSDGVAARLLPRQIRSLGADDSPFWLGPLARLSRPLIRLVRVRYLQQVGPLLDAQAGPRPVPALNTESRWASIRRLDNLSFAGLNDALYRSDLFSAVLGVAELGVALRRFRLDHGDYPDDLSALAPAYVERVPVNLFTGRPPVYERRGAGFTLEVQGTRRLESLDWTVPK